MVLWSLELASEVFHDFFAYDHGGEDAHSAGWNSRNSDVAVGKEFGIAEEQFRHENARSGVKEFATGM